MSTHDHIAAPKAGSRPSTPGPAQRISRPGTPSRSSRPGTPSRIQKDPTAEWMRKGGMPNNLQLADPRLQDRASDLLGVQGTEAVKDRPSEAELEKARQLAAKLETRAQGHKR